jgi:CubicO group peptidase (beta-lactamase class C family)
MRFRFRHSACALVPFSIAFTAAPATAQDPADRVDEIFSEWNTDGSPGCAVGVTRYGEPVFERAYGMADLEHGVPNAPGTIFEGGSVSKQFTSAAVMLLVQDGVLTLDDDVRKWVPELPDYGTAITLHRLMTHTSGLRDWGSVAEISGWGREERAHDHDDVIDILSRQSALNFEPGHEYSYSNSGFNLLAIVVARASGVPFAQFSTERIFAPLGMKDTQWRDDHRRIVRGRSSAYNRTGEGWEINRPVEYVHGNGGILTTVRDLAIWNEALTDGRLGGDEFIRLMHLEGTLSDGTPMGYAGGLFVGDFAGVRSVTHTGSTAGYRAFLGRYPEQGLSVAMLCNASNVATGTTGGEIARAFLGSAAQPDVEPDYAGMAASLDLRPYEGRYRNPVTGEAVEIRVRDGVARAGRTPLLPLSQAEFQVGADAGHRYVFDRANDVVSGFREEGALSVDRRYDRVTPWTPTAGELQELVGTYRSEDAETTYVVRTDGQTVTIWQRPANTEELTPLYRDGFAMGGGRVVRFRRDADGTVSSLSLSLGRVYDMRFMRLPEQP